MATAFGHSPQRTRTGSSRDHDDGTVGNQDHRREWGPCAISDLARPPVMEHTDAPPDDAMNAFRFDPLLTAIIEALRSSMAHEDDPAEHADEQMDLAA